MMRWLLFFLMAAGTLFFNSSRFVDPWLVPKWGILVTGMVVWGLVTAVHWVYPFDRCPVRFRSWVEGGLVALVGVEACYGLFRAFAPGGGGVASLTGTLDNAAGFAACLCVGFPFCLRLMGGTGWRRYAGVAAATVVLVAVALSASRAGILSLLAVSAVWAWKRLRFSPRVKGTTLAVLLLLLAGLLYGVKKDSADGRLLIWRCSLEMMKDRLLQGWGLGGFEAHYMDYQAAYFERHPDSRYAPLADTVQYPFSEYLNIGVAFGVVGWLAVVAFLVCLGRAYMRRPTVEKESGLLVWLAVVVFAAFSYPLMYPFVWLVLAYASVRLLEDVGTVRPLLLQAGAVCLLATCCWAGSRTYRRMKAELVWAEAVAASSLGQTEQAMEKYRRAYSVLWADRYFLYNYAAELHRHGQQDEALRVAGACRRRWADYDLELLLAELYEQRGEDIRAEAHYRRASLMCPNRFVPLHRLVLLLDRTGRADEAVRLARQLVEKPVKVPSFQVDWIKKEMNDYIIKQCE